MSERTAARNWIILCGFWLSLVVALPATAAAPAADCPTWFPDFRCERSGRFDGFHKPINAPYLFEDPFITTGLSFYYIRHNYPTNSVFEGGRGHAVALQARVALTDRLAFVATKDGVFWNRPDTKLPGTNFNILDNTTGFFNITGGLKYALFQDRERNIIVSPVLRFEIPVGSSDTFQGFGSGTVLPSIAAAWGWEKLRVTGDFGAQIPFQAKQSASLFYHGHVSYNLFKHFAPFFQLSGLTWVNSGNGSIDVRLNNAAAQAVGVNPIDLNTAQAVLGTGSFEGADIINLGSRGMAGKTMLTYALGVHVPISHGFTLTGSYERFLSNHKGIFQDRWTANLTWEF